MGTEQPQAGTQRRDWVRFPRRPGRLGAVSLARLLVFEVVQLGLFAVVFQNTWAAITGGVVGAMAIVIVFGRSHGRWWSETVALWWRFRTRRTAAAPGGRDPRLAALWQLTPDLTVRRSVGADGAEVGIGADGAGWFSVLEVTTSRPGAPVPAIPLAALARLAGDFEQAGVVVQVVSHTAPAAQPARRESVVWVAVRLDAWAVAESMVDDVRTVDFPAVLAELVRRVSRILHKRDLRVRCLAADGLVDALVRSCDLLPGVSRYAAREGWTAWSSARLSHGCFWLRTWPDPERVAGLLTAFAELPATLVSIALLIEPEDAGTSIRCLVRVASPPHRHEEACATVVRLTQHAGGRLYRLDGQHAPAVYASAPSGGGAR